MILAMLVSQKLKLVYSNVFGNVLFRRFVFGQSLSMIGDAVCLASLPLALLSAGYDATTFGVVMASVGFGTLIGAMVGGPWAEKTSARAILITTDLIRGLCQFIAAAVIVGVADWWWLILIYSWFGVGIGASRPASHLMLVSLIPRADLIKANSTLAFLDNLIAVLLPATVGIAVILTDAVWGVLIDGATFLCAAFFTALIPRVCVPSTPSVEEASGCRFRGMSTILRTPQLSLGMQATLIINVLCFPVFLVIAPYVVAETFDEYIWGLCLAASGLGACLGAVAAVVMSLHTRLQTLCVAATILLPLAMYMIATSHTVETIIIGSGLVGLVEGTWLTVWATTLQLHSPTKDLGRVVGTETLLTSGLHPFVYLGGGFLGVSLGYTSALVVVAASSFALLSALIVGKYIIKRGLL